MKICIASTAALVLSLALVGCAEDKKRGNDRWVTTENTTVAIDWDKVADAYKQAEGPSDFERRINEIYEGDEAISVSVHDQDARSQVVTGFFDRNANGAIDDGEKIFSIQRDIMDESSAQYQVHGYGPYAGYHHSMMWNIASGMLIGSMLSSAFRPNYVPVQPYTTSASRAGQMRSERNAVRSQNRAKASGSGRSYGSQGGSWGSSGRSSSPSTGTRSSGSGGRFGVRGRQRKRQHLVD
jgi:uncharacterized membrane protein YgcG